MKSPKCIEKSYDFVQTEKNYVWVQLALWTEIYTAIKIFQRNMATKLKVNK